MDIEVDEAEFIKFAEEMNRQADEAVEMLMSLGWHIPEAAHDEEVF